MGDEFDVLGHHRCPACNEWTPTVRASATKLCVECQVDVAQRAAEARFTYEVEGREYELASRPRPKARVREERRRSEEGKDIDRRRNRARHRALERLAVIYRPMFEMLFNEEKLRLGLEPTTVASAPRPSATMEALLADIEEAEEREAEAAERRAAARVR